MNYILINAKNALSFLDISNPKKILVVGCGNRGEDVKALHELLGSNVEIHGIDILDDIGAYYPHENVLYLKADITNLPIFSSYYDLAYTCATFEHIKNIGLGWKNMIRVLRPGGYLYSISSPLWMSPFGHHKTDIFQNFPYCHLRFPTIDPLLNFVNKENLQSPDSTEIIHHLRYMLDETHFNKLGPDTYEAEANNLDGISILRNDFDLLPEDTISEFDDLLKVGYSKRDLLALTHLMAAKKI